MLFILLWIMPPNFSLSTYLGVLVLGVGTRMVLIFFMVGAPDGLEVQLEIRVGETIAFLHAISYLHSFVIILIRVFYTCSGHHCSANLRRRSCPWMNVGWPLCAFKCNVKLIGLHTVLPFREFGGLLGLNGCCLDLQLQSLR